MSSKEFMKDHMLKWFIFLGAIALAFVLSSKSVSVVSNEIMEKPPLDVKEKVVVPLSHNQPRSFHRPIPSILNLVADDSTLLLFGEVGYANCEKISQEIIRLNTERSKEPILLVIDSPGGAVFAGTKIISAIEASKRPVYTVCYGLCASMAAMIHQYGHKRLMVDRSMLMFHNAAGGVEGEMNKMLSRLNTINNYVNKLDYYVAKRAQINFTEFTRMTSEELWLDAEDSLNRFFSDQTVTVNLSKLNKETLNPFTNYKRDNKHLTIENLKNVIN